MPRFRFSLESVLRVRIQERDECRNRLGSALSKLREIESRAEALEQEQNELRGYLQKQSANAVCDVSLLSRCHIHLAQLQHQRDTVSQEEEKMRGELEALRKQLVEADRNVKALENLKEKRFEEHARRLEVQSRREQEENLAVHALRKLRS